MITLFECFHQKVLHTDTLVMSSPSLVVPDDWDAPTLSSTLPETVSILIAVYLLCLC